MPTRSPYILTLNAAQRRELEARSRRYTLPYREVVRAEIVLMTAEGLDNDQIAARLDTRREIVSKWRKRFFEDGLAGPEERPRRDGHSTHLAGSRLFLITGHKRDHGSARIRDTGK